MEAGHPGRDAERDALELFAQGRGAMRLWAGWLLAGGGWALHLLASYGLVDWYCRGRSALGAFDLLLILHAVTLLSLGLALAGLTLSARNLRLLSLAQCDADGNVSYSRSRFIAMGGVIFSLYMTVIILLEEWANFVLVPCV